MDSMKSPDENEKSNAGDEFFDLLNKAVLEQPSSKDTRQKKEDSETQKLSNPKVQPPTEG